MTKRSPEIIEEILERVANGELILQMWHAEPERMPSPEVFGQWRRADKAMDAAYIQAQFIASEVIVQQAVDIVDAEPKRVLVRDSEGNYTVPGSKYDMASVAWAKNRAEMRMRYAPFYNPRFNPKLEVGGIPGQPLEIEGTADLAVRLAIALRAKGRGEEPILLEAQEPDGSDLV
jgi:hypothetical protein